MTEAKRHGVDGIICGHTHHAARHDRLGIRYMNRGDWVKSCTALAETCEGRFELLHWSATTNRSVPSPMPHVQAAAA